MADSPGSTDEKDKEPYVNPYSAHVLYLTLKQQKLQEDPTAPMFDPAELDLRQAQNAYNQRTGGLLAMSGDRRVASFGDTILRRALDEAKIQRTEHGEYNPLTGEHRFFPDYLRQREIERNDTQINRAQQLESQEQARHQQMLAQQQFQQQFAGPLKDAQAEVARQRAEAARIQNELGKPLPAAEVKDIKAKSADYSALNQVEDLMKGYETPFMGLAPAGKFTDWYAREVAPTGAFSVEDWTKQEHLQKAMQQLVLMRERHANFGSAVTKAERPYWNAAIPSRGEDPREWIRMNMQVLRRELGKELKAAAAAGYNRGQMRELLPDDLRDLVTAPNGAGMGAALEGAGSPPVQPGVPPQPGTYPVLRPGAQGLSY